MDFVLFCHCVWSPMMNYFCYILFFGLLILIHVDLKMCANGQRFVHMLVLAYAYTMNKYSLYTCICRVSSIEGTGGSFPPSHLAPPPLFQEKLPDESCHNTSHTYTSIIYMYMYMVDLVSRSVHLGGAKGDICPSPLGFYCIIGWHSTIHTWNITTLACPPIILSPILLPPLTPLT